MGEEWAVLLCWAQGREVLFFGRDTGVLGFVGRGTGGGVVVGFARGVLGFVGRAGSWGVLWTQ